MKQYVNSKRIRIAFLCVLIALFAAVVGLSATLITLKLKKSVAAGGRSATLYVYDPEQKYDDMAAWVWVNEGTAYKPSAPDDNEFVIGENKAIPIKLTLTDAEISALNDGSGKLGIIILHKSGASDSIDMETFWKTWEKDIPSDVYVILKGAWDELPEEAGGNLPIYYVRKDDAASTNINEAKMATSKITSARISTLTASGMSVEFDTTIELSQKYNVIQLLDANDKVLETKRITVGSNSKFTGSATFTSVKQSNFDMTADYYVKIIPEDGAPEGTGGVKTPASLLKTSLIDTKLFIDQFETAEVQNMQFGSFVDRSKPEEPKTTFRVWAPFASRIIVRLYEYGDATSVPAGFSDGVSNTLVMQKVDGADKKWHGVWEAVSEKDLTGKYYTYLITNSGAAVETIDPYAKACGAGGDRAMVVDLSQTDPVGWNKDKHLWSMNQANADVPIVYELHVKDFSAASNSGIKNKGKYLAFTEKGTTLSGDKSIKTGIDHLKELGITYVHLNPVYDYSSVDEGALTGTENREDFNWGYDPQNYNIPEGSYSTDPYNGNVRIKEFKQMVMALHEAGIGVIMDVVYNHTFSLAHPFHATVPYYYYRTNKAGKLTNGSGCGNETASERTMVRKYMVESVKYWATEYHIDGFRFDLMGLHDVTTMQAIRKELDTVKDGVTTIGTHILMYGEPWTGDGGNPQSHDNPNSDQTGNWTYYNRVIVTKEGYENTPYTSNKWINPDSGNNDGSQTVKTLYDKHDIRILGDRIALFSGYGRDGLRGDNNVGTGNFTSGWLQTGNIDGQVKTMLEGGCSGDDNSPPPGMRTANGTQNAAYSCAHDNYTIWDQFVGADAGCASHTAYDFVDQYNVKRCEIASSVTLMSSGISFLLAGEEMGRTKYGNHNSYNSTSKLNALDYSRKKDFKSMYDHYRQVIKVRKAFRGIYSYEHATTVANCTGWFADKGGCLGIRRIVNGNTLVAFFNAGSTAQTFTGADFDSINFSGLTKYVENGSVVSSACGSSVTVQPGGVVIVGSRSSV